jgi:hypothetical protein
MRRLVTALVAVALAATACSSVTSGVGTRAAAGPAVPGSSGAPGAASLDRQLLQLSDLPAGWQPDNSVDPSDSDAPACLREVGAAIPALSKTSAAYTAADGLPALFEGLGAFGKTARADGAFAATAALLDRCTSFVMTSGNTPLTATLTRATMQTVGDHSTVWRLLIGSSQLPVAGSGAILLARRGTELLLMLYADLGSGQVSDILPFARLAVAKMPH